jgi:hypothetical protein
LRRAVRDRCAAQNVEHISDIDERAEYDDEKADPCVISNARATAASVFGPVNALASVLLAGIR